MARGLCAHPPAHLPSTPALAPPVPLHHPQMETRTKSTFLVPPLKPCIFPPALEPAQRILEELARARSRGDEEEGAVKRLVEDFERALGTSTLNSQGTS